MRGTEANHDHIVMFAHALLADVPAAASRPGHGVFSLRSKRVSRERRRSFRVEDALNVARPFRGSSPMGLSWPAKGSRQNCQHRPIAHHSHPAKVMCNCALCVPRVAPELAPLELPARRRDGPINEALTPIK